MNAEKEIKKLVEDVLAHMGMDAAVSCRPDDGAVFCDIESPDARLLTARDGEALRALARIISTAAKKRGLPKRIRIDAEKYLSEREKDLEEKVLLLAKRAKDLSAEVPLKPMNPYERMIIHHALSSVEGVKTESRGSGKTRHIVIIPEA